MNKGTDLSNVMEGYVFTLREKGARRNTAARASSPTGSRLVKARLHRAL